MEAQARPEMMVPPSCVHVGVRLRKMRERAAPPPPPQASTPAVDSDGCRTVDCRGLRQRPGQF